MTAPPCTDPTAAAPVPAGGTRRRSRVHPAWWVAAVAFVALLGAAGFRAAPGVLMVPLEEEFGWSRTLMSSAVSVNLVLYGLMAPFAAALMDRFGIRQVTSVALLLVAAGSGLTMFVTPGLAAVADLGPADRAGHRLDGDGLRGDHRQPLVRGQRGLVMGILTAAGATGQLVFLPLMANLAAVLVWRAASLVISVAALAVVPFVMLVLRDYPATGASRAYGAPATGVEDAAGPDPAGCGRGGRCAALREAAADQDVLGAGRRVRHLRRHHQRADRHPLRPVGARPRDAGDHRGRPARPGRHLRHRRAPSSPARSPTGSTRGSCWSATTSSAASGCWCCPGCSRTGSTRACWSSS